MLEGLEAENALTMAASQQTNGQNTIPTLWRERILKRDFEIVLGKMLQSDQCREDETEESYLRSANVQWEGVDLSDVKTMWFSSAEKHDLLLCDGDLVVNEGGDVGRCAIWRSVSESIYFQNAINRVRARTSASTRYLYYWLYNLKHSGFIDAMVSRITIAHLTAEKLARVPWPNVPSAEQHRIAAYLDASCVAIDAAVAAKGRQIETLDALCKTIVHKAVTCGLCDNIELKNSGVEWLGKVPVHWQIKRIKDIVDLKSGDAITSDNITPIGNYPVFGGNGLRGYTISYTHNGYYVLIGRQGVLCGNINYAKGKFWASEHAVVAITLKKHDIFWFGELLRVMNLNQYSNAAAQPGLAVEKIKFLRIPIPPYEEQIQISSWLKNMIIKNEEIVSILRKQIATLTAYRKSLIHECVTGQRRIAEPDVVRSQLSENTGHLKLEPTE